MLAKDLDPFESADPRELAGRAAEEQMAFYLKRRFLETETVWVFNGLRFEYKGIFTQIDHLLLTKWGFFAVESKSVTTQVRINARGEWSRLVDGEWRGMASPLEQGNDQLMQLVRLINDNAPVLLGKFMGALQKYAGNFERIAYCAISDNGIIERETANLCPTALKADQVCAALVKKLEELKKDARFFGNLLKPRKDPVLDFSDAELLKLKDFLLKAHQPLTSSPP